MVKIFDNVIGLFVIETEQTTSAHSLDFPHQLLGAFLIAFLALEFQHYRFFSHRACAATFAALLRSLGVIVCKRRLPPILPPLRPISAMSIETCSFVGRSVSLSPCVETSPR